MKRILINATQNEEIRVALCNGNHLYDFDLENRTREQKKSNIYKGHVTRVEPSLEAVFVEYGSQRQGFLPIREISSEYLSGNPRDENIKKLIKEGDELIVQVEKEERGNKGAALSTYVSLAGRYLVLMPNNPRGGGISRQISGKLREDMKRMLGNLDLPKGMSVIIRTAGIGKTQEDLQHDLNHLLNIWQAITEQNQKYPSPRLVHQEAGVVTRAVRDYLRDDISEIWIDNENAYIEAAGFIDAVMPKQAEKLRKYTDYEPMFSRFNVEKQIETAYQREVRLPSGGSIVIDQTEALVSIDINSAKSTRGSDVAETAFHTNLEAADEIARQLRLRDMGGLIVIDFIDMNDSKNQKEVEKRLIDATKYDRARVQFGDISKFGLMEMSRQRLRPSLEESTGYICPRCHGNGMIRDLRSLSLSIMRQIEQIALKERQGEVQAEVPTDIAAFLLNEKRDSLVYLEQDSGTRITILPHAHLESPNFKLHFNRDGFAPSSYERITDTAQENSDLGYTVDWQTAEKERPEQQPTRQPRQESKADNASSNQSSAQSSHSSAVDHSNQHRNQSAAEPSKPSQIPQTTTPSVTTAQPQAIAWLSNLFAQAPQAQMANVSGHDAAEAIEALVNTGAKSLGSIGQVDNSALDKSKSSSESSTAHTTTERQSTAQRGNSTATDDNDKDNKNEDRRRRKSRKPRPSKSHHKKDRDDTSAVNDTSDDNTSTEDTRQPASDNQSRSDNTRNRQNNKNASRRNDDNQSNDKSDQDDTQANATTRNKRKPNSRRDSRGALDRGETLEASATSNEQNKSQANTTNTNRSSTNGRRSQNPDEVVLQVNEAPVQSKTPEVVHLSLDNSKASTAQASIGDQGTDSAKNTDAIEQQTAPIIENESNNNVATEKASTDEQPVEDIITDKPLLNDVESSDKSVEPPVTKANIESTSSNESVADKQPDVTTTSEVASKEFASDHKALFASRYVAAVKFGQASNDPRVVRARNQQASSIPQESEAKPTSVAPTKMAAIKGSVGAFIRATLEDAEARLTSDGIINCFIAAIESHTEQSSSASDTPSNTSIKPKLATSEADFDFSNYGYESLTADYLDRFKAMTEAVSQVAIAQGKTEVTPRAIGRRADNDPRGQHSNFVEADEPIAQEAINTDNSAEIKTEVAADKIAATAMTGQAQAEEVTNNSEQLLESKETQPSETDIVDAEAVDNNETKETTLAEKSKTTIASYKNMIENVAEQLLPQTGMFNLNASRVPKARTRKPKAEHKKPTQAESLGDESDDTKGSDDS